MQKFLAAKRKKIDKFLKPYNNTILCIGHSRGSKRYSGLSITYKKYPEFLWKDSNKRRSYQGRGANFNKNYCV